MMAPVRSFLVFHLALVASALAPHSTAQERKYLLDRVDDMAVVQLYVDGFDQLSLTEKTLVYHLSEAAIAGRDIFIDQKY